MYNVACTLRAFRRVQDKYPDATLTLVGSGSEDQALRRLAAELNLQHVRFAGRVAPSDIHRYYADADIYLQTPDIDNMPSSVLEAFASGCPVVATHAGGVPAILTDRVHGLLVPCGDAERTAEAVCRVIDDPVLASELLERRPGTVGLAVPRIVAGRSARGAGTQRESTVNVLQRLRGMDADELRFRLATHTRRTADRALTALGRPAQL